MEDGATAAAAAVVVSHLLDRQKEEKVTVVAAGKVCRHYRFYLPIAIAAVGMVAEAWLLKRL